MEQNLYKLAAQKQYRFPSGKGSIGVEDLFDLSLESLDSIAVNLDKQLQEAGGKSFINKRNTATRNYTDTNNKLELVKDIINTKMEEEEAAKARALKASQKQFLKSLLEQKQLQQLQNLSVEEIQAQLQGLE